jgi:fatty-acyl-CoA synthase
MPAMSIPAYDWLAHHRRRTPHKLALVDLYSGRRLRWEELDARAGRLARFLAEGLGVERGARVALLAPNSSDVFEIQFACARLGAIFVPLNWRLAPPELEFILADAEPRVLIHDREFAQVGEALAAACRVPHRVELAGDGSESPYERGIAGAGAPLQPVPLTHDDVSSLLYTSGTTGRPKGALITHGMTFWNAVNLGGPALVTPRSVGLTVLPLFHTGGLNCYANVILHAGGTVQVMRSWDPDAALRRLEDSGQGLTHFFGVPAHYLFMSQHPAFETADLRHLSICGVGGAPVPLPLLETWAQKGVPLQQGYGMTETSPSVLVLDADQAVRKIGSTGLPVLHTQVRLVGEDGRDVAPGQVGELQVKGPNVTPGYWRRPEATAEAISDGWLHTGDAARVDDEGYYTIVDRWKDMYISGGENVYPAEVESVLHGIDGVVEAAVIGVSDTRWGEVGRAIVVRREGTRLDEEAVLAHCRGRLARYKIPRSVVFVKELPRNAAGKVLKRELRAQLGDPGAGGGGG